MSTYVILVENPEASLGEFSRVAVGEKLLVNTQESRLSQLAIGTILPEAFVPLLDFPLGD